MQHQQQSMSRHSSISLPAINTNQSLPNPKSSLSAKTNDHVLKSPLSSPRYPPPLQQTIIPTTTTSTSNSSSTTSSSSNSNHHSHNHSNINININHSNNNNNNNGSNNSYYLSSPTTPRSATSSFSSHLSPLRTTFAAPSIPEGSPLDFTLPCTRNHSAFRRVRDHHDLRPILSNIDRSYHHTHHHHHHYTSPLLALTRDLNTTYQLCNDTFRYNAVHNPRRVLTKPSKPCGNDGYDNEDFDYILYVNDILGSTEGHKYLILDVLGAGTFGQVVKCRNTKTQQIFAVKVVKNKTAYFKQSMMEVAILEMLNQRHDPEDQHHILRLKDTFIHKKHLCLVFELLSVNLYELIKQNQFRGLSTNLVRVFTAQILDALTILNEARIIHCDLKPENILLKNLESPTIKVIDFGSACHEVQTMYTYIQSRFYRSPEVLVGLPYTSAIDMWSLGCIATELFLGLPLFPGSSEYNQISRIVEMLGVPPNYMIEMGKNANRYFERYTDEQGEKKYKLRSLEQYSQEQGKTEQPSKRYFAARTLPDLINNYPIMRKASMTPKEIEKEKQNRLAFIDFLQGLLNLNHFERWSPQQAKLHPFITGEEFTGHFKPPSYIRRKQPSMKIPSSMPSSLPVIHDEATPTSPSSSTSPGSIPSYLTQQQQPPIPPAPGGYRSSDHRHSSQSLMSSTSSPYSSSLPNYYTHNSMLLSSNAMFRQQQQQQPPPPPSLQQQQQVTSAAAAPPPPPLHTDTADRPFLHHHRASYNGMSSLPRVLEPPDAMCYRDPVPPPQPPLTVAGLGGSLGPPPSTTVGSGGGRPRANTIGTMHAPPQPPPPPIQLDSSHHHQQSQQQHLYRHSFMDSNLSNSSSTSLNNTGNKTDSTSNLLPLPVSSSTNATTTDQQQQQQRWDWILGTGPVMDLERDGDDSSLRPMTHHRSTQHHPTQHRRSNSSIQFSDMGLLPPAASLSNVANLHRRVRGHPPVAPYSSRQDLEWDGITPSPGGVTTMHHQHNGRKWNNEKSGWTIA
ncbi:kinase-like domain-containing protein [Phascolomyces articulosus]|uniref:Kinase-like domain-containing protein n=1 Tax=Phascolomyces articulosus TaxID=60185 RepID=A0AAD5PG86_9FUNG|nr:kinase-like domain-containing protein [Phascolomyces articulosus]